MKLRIETIIIALLILAGVAVFAAETVSILTGECISAVEVAEAVEEAAEIGLPGWVDFLMEKVLPFVFGALAAFGISLALGYKFMREFGEALIATADFGDGNISWPELKKEILDVILLFRDKSPWHTVKGVSKTGEIVEKVRGGRKSSK